MDIRKFKLDIQKAGLTTKLPARYQGRMSRLELLNAQMWGEAKKAAVKQTALQTAAHRATIDRSFYRSIYDVSRGIGFTPAFAKLDTKTVNKILTTKFYGKNYSKRIWGNTNILAKQLQQKLGVAVATGQSVAKTSREIAERFNVSKHYAERLVRTETNYFSALSDIESYESMGVEKYKILATLDNRTSKICQSMDGKIFFVKDAEPGVNLNPFHPYCRTTTVAYFGKEWEPEQRIARNPKTGKNYYVPNMSYDKWRREFVDSKNPNVFNRLGSGIIFNSVTVSGIAGSLLNQSLNQADSIIRKSPNLQKFIENNGGLEIYGSNLPAKAATTLDGRQIMLSNAFMKDIDAYIATLQNEIKLGSKIAVLPKDYLKYTITHEMGHVVQIFITNKYGISSQTAKEDLISIATRQSGLSRQDVLNQMSGYGNKSPEEFFAEAFLSYNLNVNNIWNKAMKEFLQGKL